jgi:hypothetical protein
MPIQYGQVFGQGVKYLKVSRYDSGGLDRSGYLGQLTNLTINYDDLGSIQYNIVTTQEQDTYFVLLRKLSFHKKFACVFIAVF